MASTVINAFVHRKINNKEIPGCSSYLFDSVKNSAKFPYKTSLFNLSLYKGKS
jgi:hypothetical protein